MKYISQPPLLLNVHMHNPTVSVRSWMDSLLAFFPGLQVSTFIIIKNANGCYYAQFVINSKNLNIYDVFLFIFHTGLERRSETCY